MMEKSQAGPTVVEVVRSGPGIAPLLHLTGELDHFGASRFEEALQTVLSDSTRCVLLDLTGLLYVDSGGIAAFSRLLRTLETRGWVGIIGMDDRVRRVFVITGLATHPHLRFFESEEDAVCGWRASPEARGTADA